jgi:hypothetical protein
MNDRKSWHGYLNDTFAPSAAAFQPIPNAVAVAGPMTVGGSAQQRKWRMAKALNDRSAGDSTSLGGLYRDQIASHLFTLIAPAFFLAW